jgi:hypothetical protein
MRIRNITHINNMAFSSITSPQALYDQDDNDSTTSGFVSIVGQVHDCKDGKLYMNILWEDNMKLQ